MIQYDENCDDSLKRSFVIHPLSDPTRGQPQFCHNLIAILFENEIVHAHMRFPK